MTPVHVSEWVKIHGPCTTRESFINASLEPPLTGSWDGTDPGWCVLPTHSGNSSFDLSGSPCHPSYLLPRPLKSLGDLLSSRKSDLFSDSPTFVLPHTDTGLKTFRFFFFFFFWYWKIETQSLPLVYNLHSSCEDLLTPTHLYVISYTEQK